ncbi:penicillin-binding protein activator [Massilia sp. ST3]|uniref:penicillin-binding protein activator n=1 Tax=Massilia sp. ST3 TaxID=2824903 RepID=UPI001B810011|nr:penicillin-binding protein activator [Massilia sp. ST3]MBQ5950338.1 penicillin-binding protein activator [Massilia sp. ST3]
MLKKKNLKGLIAATATASLLAACGSSPLPPDTGCGVPGGLCAPAAPVTSAPPVEATYTPPPPADTGVRTSPVELPPRADGSPAAPLPAGGARIALLLPLESSALAQPADAVRQGFMAAYERDRAGVTVNVMPTGDSAQATLDAYARAAEQNDIVVGPLARSAVAALAGSGAVSKPTIALNHPQTSGPLPRQMLVIGLSLEDEARQVADWAAAEQPGGRALVVTGPAAWQQRLSGAFAARWSQLGNTHTLAELPIADGYVDGNALADLRARLQADPPQLVYAALDAVQLRQVRSALGTSLPTYGTASVNPGRDPGASAPELAGVRILDLPWTVQPDHPAVSVYPRWSGNEGFDMQRLYALGIDAFRIARELAQRPTGAFEVDGVTGRLKIDMGGDGSSGSPAFRRVESGVVYRDGGVFEQAAFGR